MHTELHRQSRRAAAFLLLSAAFAVAQVPTAGTSSPRVLPAPPGLLQQFDVVAGTVQELNVPAAPSGHLAIEVVIRGQVRQLVLYPYDVRTPDFQLVVVDAQGSHVVPTPPSVTWQGHVGGDPDSAVAASLVDGGMTAMIRLGNLETWSVQPVRQVQPAAGAALHVVFFGGDSINHPVSCATVGNLATPAPYAAPEEVIYECQIVPEADPLYYQQAGGTVVATQNDITQMINAMNVIYERDVQIRIVVPQMIINTGADWYTSSVAGTLLTQFANYWQANRGGVTRDLAHLFTGRPMGQASGGAIGIAYLNAVCNTGIGYGVSQGHWTTNFARRVAVTAHEVGHNFSAQHCDAVPPCYIMCSGVGGCANVQTSFSQNEKNQIIAFRQQVGCLTAVATPPVIAAATPSSVKTFLPPAVTLTGTGFVGVNQVQIDGVAVVTPAIQVLSDTSMRFTPTSGLTPGFHLVRVVNSAGPSNQWPVTFTVTQPCEIRVAAAVLGGSNLAWDMGGTPNDAAYLGVSLLNTTSPIQAWPLIDGFSPLWLGSLSAGGIAQFSTVVPPQILNGIRIYSQMLAFDPNTFVVRSTSAVGSTLVIF